MANMLEKFDEFFNSPEGLSMPRIESFVHESLKFLDQLKEKLENGTEEEKQKAMKSAQELQKKMMEQAEKALKASGLSQKDLEKFLTQPANFSSEEWDVLNRAKSEMSEYQKDMSKGGMIAPPKHDQHKQAKPTKKPGKGGWIQG